MEFRIPLLEFALPLLRLTSTFYAWNLGFVLLRWLADYHDKLSTFLREGMFFRLVASFFPYPCQPIFVRPCPPGFGLTPLTFGSGSVWFFIFWVNPLYEWFEKRVFPYLLSPILDHTPPTPPFFSFPLPFSSKGLFPEPPVCANS